METKLLGKLFKKKEDLFTTMTPAEKKEFLSNDMIERMIRVEQRVALSFGETLKYDKTQCFKSLTPAKQKKFNSYLKYKKSKRALGYSFLLFLGFSFLFFSLAPMTGNAILDGTPLEGSSWIFLALLIFFLMAVMYYLRVRKERNKRLEGVYHLVDSSLKKRIKK